MKVAGMEIGKCPICEAVMVGKECACGFTYVESAPVKEVEDMSFVDGTRRVIELMKPKTNEEVIEKQMNAILYAAGKVLDAHEKLRAEQAVLTSLQDRNNYRFKRALMSIVKEDKPMIDRVGKIMSAVEKSNGIEMKAYVYKAFRAIFKNMSSRTIVICKGKGRYTRDATIVMGEYGFGIRYNQNAHAVSSFDELQILYNARDAISLSMKNLGYKKWVEKFEKFWEIAPDVGVFKDHAIIRFPVEEVVMFVHDPSRYGDSQTPPERVTEIQFELENKWGASVDDGLISVVCGDTVHALKISDSSISAAYCYVQMRKLFPKYIKVLEENMQPIIDKAIKSQDEIGEAFGREILLMSA